MEDTAFAPSKPKSKSSRLLETMFKIAVIIIAVFILLVFLLTVGRTVIYKIHPYERGLHMSGGRFIGVDMPGWHAQIPFWDTVIIIRVNERLGYIERIPAMTSDDVTMVVSLQYTYVVTDPVRFALEVDDPERIIFEFVQGKLRDVVNTKTMTEVMHSRTELNQEIMEALRKREEQYGVRFITIQIQSASPPDEVVQAIKDRMVAVQRKEQAQAEAEQSKTLADAKLYDSQKKAEAEAYMITKTAEAQKESIRLLLTELDKHSEIGQKYLDYLIAKELEENSKWIIGGGGVPIIDLRPALES